MSMREFEGKKIGSLRGMMQRGWERIENGFTLCKKFYTPSGHYYYVSLATRRNVILKAHALKDGMYYVRGLPSFIAKAIEADIEYSFRRGRDDERATVAQVGLVEG